MRRRYYLCCGKKLRPLKADEFIKQVDEVTKVYNVVLFEHVPHVVKETYYIDDPEYAEVFCVDYLYDHGPYRTLLTHEEIIRVKPLKHPHIYPGLEHRSKRPHE